MAYDFGTAGDIVNDAAVEIGLAEVSDPFTSTDSNFIQLCRLLKSLGRELVHMRSWTHLRKEYTFTTVAGTAAYDLPADFHNYVDQTWWNRTNRLPLGGPLSAQEWQYLKARMANVVFNVLFRPINDQILLYPDSSTPGDYDIYFEYSSSWWVSDDVTPTVTSRDYPLYSTDTLWFDPLLLTRGLKLAFLKAKGFDTTYAQQDYDQTLELVKGHDSPANILNLTKSTLGSQRTTDIPMGGQSVPITGFGS
jgi:hypothetical protein